MDDLRSHPAAAPSLGYATPAQVPARVDDVALRQALAAGRPDGVAGVIELDGARCPTISAGPLGADVRDLLCVHGLGHDSWDWAPLFVRCSKEARVSTLDLPGFGLSGRPARRVDLTLLTDAVLAAARRLATPPLVVASSLGAHVALLAALRAPAAFSKLLLCAPGGLVEIPAVMQATLRSFYSVDAIVGRSDAEIIANSRRIFATPGLALDDALAARKLAVHRSEQARAFAAPVADVVDDVFRHVVLDRLPQLRVPAVFVSGSRDLVVPHEVCARAARSIGARFVSLDGVGHCPHLEAPELFAETVRAALLASAIDG